MTQDTSSPDGLASPSPVKLCECGCGLPVPIAKVTNKARGYVKGQPIRFVARHHGGVKGPAVAKRKLFIEAGQRFGRSVVIDPEIANLRAGNASAQRAARLRCDCGTQYTRAVAVIFRKGDAESCNSCAPAADLTGQRFGKLTVVRWVQSRGVQGRWLCLCDCGNEVTPLPSILTRGHVKSCGCGRFGPRGDLAVDEAGLTRVIRKYERGARDRSIAWELTRDDVRRLISSDCQYCGAAPATSSRQWRGGDAKFVYNGIDRIDNSGPYRLGNVFSACQPCNMAKRDRPFGDWAEWAARFAAYQAEHPAALLVPPAAA